MEAVVTLNPVSFAAVFLMGFAMILTTTWVVDRLGTVMYERGFAKPFYVKGRRVHHRIIYFIVPACYTLMATMFLMGYLQVLWDSLWLKFADAAVLLGCAITADLLGDRFWPQIRKDAILHHEWIYMVLPVFIFTNVVKLIL